MASAISCKVRPKVITALRAEKGWTQKELARVAGLSRRSIASLEAAEGDFAPLTIGRVAKAFRVSPESLVRGKKSRKVAIEVLTNPPQPDADQVVLIVVIKGKREHLDETLPCHDLRKRIATMIAEGTFMPWSFDAGSIVITAVVQSLAAVELILHFSTTRDTRSKIIQIRVPKEYAYLVPTTPAQVSAAERRLNKRRRFASPTKLKTHLLKIMRAVNNRDVLRRVNKRGEVVLVRGPGRTSVKDLLVPS